MILKSSGVYGVGVGGGASGGGIGGGGNDGGGASGGGIGGGDPVSSNSGSGVGVSKKMLSGGRGKHPSCGVTSSWLFAVRRIPLPIRNVLSSR